MSFENALGVQRRTIHSAEVRTAGDEFALVGYACKYNVLSHNLGGFREKISPGVFGRSLKNNADVKALFNHNPSNILGRTKSGTLKLEDTPVGLRFYCALDKNSQAHKDLYGAVKRGDIDECSFAFTVPPGGDEWEDGTDEETGRSIQIRTLKDVDLLDVSVVTNPAYPNTQVDARQALKIRESHGLIEAVRVMRKMAQAMVMRWKEPSPTGFASHLQRCHEAAELAYAYSAQAGNVLSYDEDEENPDEMTRGAFRVANAALEVACQNLATARLQHAKVLGRRK